MELGNLEETRDAFHDAKTKESQQEEGEEVTLVVNATGGPHKMSFKVGVTVAYVKLALQQQYGLPMATTQLKLNGRPLLDPLSLSDCPGISAGQEVSVEVINT
uniref:Ubiquitin-like domain-containing protein n=1 Tax=Chlamydomonas euryale TaxID=1486919 RepID=A0A7R9YTT3_9CHLO|mmetsp:Transcript_21637/g.64817  ORF Transcript_21637/g.64817 Transcript_21637/m.64817 type:complete len:103 (+) Transcript_21637:136-444(+)